MFVLISTRLLLSKFLAYSTSWSFYQSVSLNLARNVLVQRIMAFALLFLGVSVISFGSILMKLSELELSPNATIFNRFWIASLIFGSLYGYKLISRRRMVGDAIKQSCYTSRDVLLLLSAGIFWAATLSLLAWSLTQTTVAISVILHNLSPIFTSIAACLLFRKSFDRVFCVGMVIAIGGALAIEIQKLHIAPSEFQGGLAAISSAIFLTAYLLTVEELRTKFDPVTIQFWICGIASLTIFPILLVNKEQLFPSSLNTWLCVTGLALICQVVGQGLITYSLASFSSVIVSLVRLLEPVLSSASALVIFSERLSFSNCLGFTAVLIGLYIAISNQFVSDCAFSDKMHKKDAIYLTIPQDYI